MAGTDLPYSSSSSSSPFSSALLTPSTTPSTPAVEETTTASFTPSELKVSNDSGFPRKPEVDEQSSGRAGSRKNCHRHLLDPLDRECHPEKDDRPVEELLARPRLPRSPYERYKNDILPPAAASDGEAAGLSTKHAQEFEGAKEKLRAAWLELEKRKVAGEK